MLRGWRTRVLFVPRSGGMGAARPDSPRPYSTPVITKFCFASALRAPRSTNGGVFVLSGAERSRRACPGGCPVASPAPPSRETEQGAPPAPGFDAWGERKKIGAGAIFLTFVRDKRHVDVVKS